MSRMRLRSISSTEAQSLSIIAQRAQDIPLGEVGRDLGHDADAAGQPSISLQPNSGSPADWANDEALLIRFQWSGAQFVVVMTAANALVLLQRLCVNAPLGVMPAAWQSALDHLIVEWIRHAVALLGRGHPDLLELVRKPSGVNVSRPAHVFEVLLDADGRGEPTVTAELHSDALGVHLIAGLCGGLPPNVQPSLRQELTYRIPLTVGSTRLPATAVRGLQRGSIVFVEHARFSSERLFWLSLGGDDRQSVGFVARYEDLSITLLRGPMENTNPTSETDVSDDSETNTANDLAPVSLDNLPVTLAFDCGSVTMTLTQIEQLAPGQVIPTTRALNDYVSIRANGAVIGRGVLMEVDGRLAVNITEIATASTPVSAQAAPH